MFFRTGSTGSTSLFSREVYSLFLIDCMIFLSLFLDVLRMSVSSFFPRTAWLWNPLPIECFPLTYNLDGFKSRINRHLLTVGFLKRFSVCFNIFVLQTPCLVVAVQSCMERIPIKKSEFILWGIIEKKKTLPSVKIAFIGIISMPLRFNQNRVRYVNIFRVSEVTTLRYISRLFLKVVLLLELKKKMFPVYDYLLCLEKHQGFIQFQVVLSHYKAT